MDTKITADSNNVCYIATIQSAYPDNINTAEVLRIGELCIVADVYQIICDRKNFKTVEVGKHKQSYTVQEIRNMSIHERVGDGGRTTVGDVVEDRNTTPAPAANPLPPDELTTFYPVTTEGQWRVFDTDETLTIPIPVRPTLAQIIETTRLRAGRIDPIEYFYNLP